MFDAGPPPKLWIPPRPAIIRSAEPIIKPSLADVMFVNAWLTQGTSISGLFWQGSASSGTDGASFTFSSQPLGTAAANRHIIVAQFTENEGDFPDTMTIGGISASLIGLSRIFAANVPTGETGSIVLTYDASRQFCHIGIWAYYTASLSVSASGGAGGSSGAVTSPAGGACVWATAKASTSDQTHSIDSSFTERAEIFTEQNSAFADFSGTFSGTVTSTWSGSGDARFTWASFNS